MAQSGSLLMKIVASSVSAAGRAGKIIRDVMQMGELGIVDKGINDLQTEADRGAQRCIVASLARQYPNITIIGEEGQIQDCEVPSDWIVTNNDVYQLGLTCPDTLANVQQEDVVVWVDPLDGTQEYTKGLVEHVTVLIGIAFKGEAVAGVVHQPFFKKTDNTLGRTIWGVVGAGVGGFSPGQPPTDRLIVTTTRSHSSESNTLAVDALKPDEILAVGGAGHKVMLLLEGKANVYVFASKGYKKWDTCAPEAILRALHGRLTDVHGRSYSYDKNVEHMNAKGIIATTPHQDHDKFIRLIPDYVKDSI